jgi:hypothetical protein
LLKFALFVAIGATEVRVPEMENTYGKGRG